MKLFKIELDNAGNITRDEAINASEKLSQIIDMLELGNIILDEELTIICTRGVKK